MASKIRAPDLVHYLDTIFSKFDEVPELAVVLR